MKTPQFVTQVGEHWCLKDDKNLTPVAVEKGTIQLEEFVRKEASKFIKEGSCVLDVGAFIGDTTLDFLEMGAKVWAFEPQRDAFACLKHNCGDKATVFNAAAGDGTRVVCASDTYQSQGNMGTRQLDVVEKGATSLRLDDIDLPKIDFIKVDVEGFEYRVFKGMLDIMLDSRPIILCEVFPEMMLRYNDSPKRLYRLMKSLDYSREVVIGAETEPRCDVLFTPNAQ